MGIFLHKFRILFILVLYASFCIYLFNCEPIKHKRVVKKPDNVYDILKVKETVKQEFDKMWKASEEVYELHDNTTQDIMNDYWHKLIESFSEINDVVKFFDRKIIRAQPSSLMNIIFNTQDMDAVQVLGATETETPEIHWHVRFLEISSLTTQANWFYNKRIYDILHANKYLKSVAESISNLYGYPWFAPISVKKEANITNRLHMKEFWKLARQLINRQKNGGDIFFGIRTLIDKSRNVLTSSTIDSDSCINQDYGEIIPIRLDGPLYIAMYLSLFHIKMFVIRNFSYIYQQVYAGIVFPGIQEKIKGHVDEDIDSTLRLYNKSFGNYSSLYGSKLIPVMRGYFKCDPPDLATNPKNYIEIVNFLNVFIAPQRQLDPTGTCSEACNKIGTKPSSVNCDSPKNDKEKAFCTELPCPLDNMICSAHSNPRAVACPSKYPYKLYDWFEMGFKHFGPTTPCEENLVGFTGKHVTFTNSTGGVGKKNSLQVATRADKKINDEKENEDDDEGEDCEVCMCQCYSPLNKAGFLSKNTVRTFSLKDAMAKVDENRVLVGVKFEKVQDQIHLMIADAKLKPEKTVDMSTIVWRKPSGPANPSKPNETIALDKGLSSVYLQSWKVSPGYVVTGVRFTHSSVKSLNKITQYIGLEVHQTLVDDEAGKVLATDSEWMAKQSGSGGNLVYNGYVEPDHPSNLNGGTSMPDSSAEQLISFRSTSIKKHAGQSVIPFFDAQPTIFPNKSYAIKGVGIYHRHKVGFGGFLGIKLLPYEGGKDFK